MADGKKTGGRKKGTPNRATAAKAAAIAESGLTPLDYMLEIMRGQYPEDADAAQIIAWEAMRLDAAKAAAPYVHPKLQPVDGKTGSSEIQARVRVEFVGTAP